MQGNFLLQNRPVFLIGFMGCGKSYWGRQWAANWHLPFKDMDGVIEEEAQMKVADIFEKQGEDYFRHLEANALRSLPIQSAVIACGGGMACFHNNMEWMNAHGITVYLQASPAYLLQNILKEPGVRPLAKNKNEAELLFFIERKLRERNPFYHQAQIILNVEQAHLHSLSSIIHQ